MMRTRSARRVMAVGLCTLLAACTLSRRRVANERPPAPADAGRPVVVTTDAPADVVLGPASPGAAAGSLAVDPPLPGDEDCTEPARRCPGSCRTLGFVRGAERKRVRCGSGEDCAFALTIESQYTLAVGECSVVGVALAVERGDGQRRVHSARLAPAAWDELLAIARKLTTELDLSTVTGECPACSGADTTTLRLGHELVRYPTARPPSALGMVDGFVNELIDQLLGCRGDHLEDVCSLRQEPELESTDACAFEYTPERGPATRCTLAPGVSAPCRAALECLCSGAALGRVPETTIEACVDSWLTLADMPSFADVCVEGAQAGAPRSLSEALVLFADGQRATVSPSGACGELEARF